MTPTFQPRVEPDFEEARKTAEKQRQWENPDEGGKRLQNLARAYLALLARAEAAEERNREYHERLIEAAQDMARLREFSAATRAAWNELSHFAECRPAAKK
jgi:hypothetical protein